MSNKMGFFPTGIESLDKLMPFQGDKGGVVRMKHGGFFGVIFGAAGSGKSILSLQLSFNFAAQNAGCHAIYITQESSDVVRHKIENDFAFAKQSKSNPKPEIFTDVNDDVLKKWKWESGAPSTLTIVQLSLDPAEQTAKLVNLFQLINGRFCWSEANEHDCEAKPGDCEKDPKEHLLVCVDNAETITPGALVELTQKELLSPNGERDPNFFKKLRAWCVKHRLNTWFAFEEEKAQQTDLEETQISTEAQAYAADIVLRLGVTVFAAGYRERSLEIVKAKNQFYRRGRHHYSIHGWSKKAPDAPTGIIVYPSLPTQLHVLGGKPDPDQVESTQSLDRDHIHQLNINEVDDAVLLRNPGKDPSKRGYLAAGTVSVLVSDLDSVAPEIALHFALQDKERTLYVSLQHQKTELEGMAAKYSSLRGRMSGTVPQFPATFHCEYLAPEHISESKLLQDIDRAICHSFKDGNARRVVLDNIFALESKFPLIRNEQHFLTALFQLFRTRGVTALIVDVVEVGEGRNPLDKSFAAGVVDHVFVLRHVEFQSHTRKVFSVLKLAGLHEPQELWEIESAAERIQAHDRLEFYKGILAGQPEPVRITLSLYADSPGSPLDQYLKTQRNVLRQVFGQNIELHTCHPEDYAALQQSVSTGELRALGDCHIISIDEIWLQELLKKPSEPHEAPRLHEMEKRFFPTKSGEWKWGNYVTAAVSLAMPDKARETSQNDICGLAMPDRNDCGILAFNPNMSGWVEKLPAANKCVKSLTGRTVRKIATKQTCTAAITWDELIAAQSAFVESIPKDKAGKPGNWPDWHEYRRLEPDPVLLRHTTGNRQPPAKHDYWGVFTLMMEQGESCVSFLLELVLGFLPTASAAHLVDDKGIIKWGSPLTSGHNPWVEGLIRLLSLLDPWDIHRLADAWFRRSQIERPCLFSRQWFSSWGVLGLRFPGLAVLELPKGEKVGSTPVSGAWYLGILNGGTAFQAAAHLIRRLTSSEAELHKLNYGIGLPVRRALFDADTPLEAIPPLPYKDRFKTIAAAQSTNPHNQLLFKQHVKDSTCPFYRSRIKCYTKVSPLLLGLITNVARAALAPKYKPWLTTRQGVDFPSNLRTHIGKLTEAAEKRCKDLQNDPT